MHLNWRLYDRGYITSSHTPLTRTIKDFRMKDNAPVTVPVVQEAPDIPGEMEVGAGKCAFNTCLHEECK